MLIKPEIRIIGWDDGPFESHRTFGSGAAENQGFSSVRKKGKAVLIGVIFRGGNFFDGILKTEADIDGFDSTKKIADAIMKSKYGAAGYRGEQEKAGFGKIQSGNEKPAGI
ncbi:MAG: DUF99 family protein [Nanoarchaeota archaeon]|nr:DUF99 family protein [Nanoarchaeota archaeon]